MTTVLVVDGATLLAHGIHYAIVAFGLLGLGFLLAPALLPVGRARGGWFTFSPGSGTGPGTGSGPDDDHARRVALLRHDLGLTAPKGSVAPRPTPVASPVALTPATVPATAPVPSAVATTALALPVALVSSAAAAGVHAAAGPAHFSEGLLFGSFFLLAAMAQLAWAGWALLSPSRRLLVVGAVGNLAVVALWTATRSVGLPGGLLPEPEAIGAWDLAATGWELVTAAICLTLLRDVASPARCRATAPWHPFARAWLVSALLIIVVLTVRSGGGS